MSILLNSKSLYQNNTFCLINAFVCYSSSVAGYLILLIIIINVHQIVIYERVIEMSTLK